MQTKINTDIYIHTILFKQQSLHLYESVIAGSAIQETRLSTNKFFSPGGDTWRTDNTFTH